MKMILAAASTLLIMAQAHQAFACGNYVQRTPADEVSDYVGAHFSNLKNANYSKEHYVAAIWAKDARVVRFDAGRVGQTRSVSAAIKMWNRKRSNFKSYQAKTIEMNSKQDSAKLQVEVDWSNHKTVETFTLQRKENGWRIARVEYTKVRTTRSRSRS